MQLQVIMLIVLAGGMLLLIAAATHFSGQGSLDNIKAKTVGDGQHGTARWANKKEIHTTYRHIPFKTSEWRSGKNRPKAQGLVLGCVGKKNAVTALVDIDDIHCLMIGASGVVFHPGSFQTEDFVLCCTVPAPPGRGQCRF